ncbi:hypothetical protein TrVFT333_008282 [Trichoderma virens FT-333]|nr:hypothetical protein TrVFT333_008282 [Trichoderma virens FT-333]
MPPKAASASTPGSATKSSGTWDNVEFLNDLLVAFYQVGNQAGSFNQQSNAAIVEFLTAQGHETSWSAIRPQVHEDILVSVFHNVTLSTEDWTKVMTDLKEMGYVFSESALRYAELIWRFLTYF